MIKSTEVSDLNHSATGAACLIVPTSKAYTLLTDYLITGKSLWFVLQALHVWTFFCHFHPFGLGDPFGDPNDTFKWITLP